MTVVTARVWYNAKIERILADGTCEVLFLDYGNSDQVRPGEIVLAVKDIPEGEDLDECVDLGAAPATPEKRKFEVDQLQPPVGEEDFFDMFLEGFQEAGEESRDTPNINLLQEMFGGNTDKGQDYGAQQVLLAEHDLNGQTDHRHEYQVEKTLPASTAGVGGTVMTCRVCYVLTPGQFYLQEKEKEVQLEELLERLDLEYYQNSEELRLPGSLISEGQLCVVMWSVDNHFYRATIVEAQNSHQFKMEFFDYGNVSLHSREELYILLPDFQPHKYPRMCQKARLHGVQPVDPRRWDRRASETLVGLTGGGVVARDVEVTTRLVSMEGDRWSVALEVEEEEEGGGGGGGQIVDVGEKLASLGLVLLEFKEVKPATKLDSDSDLLPALEKLSSILRHKKVSLEPSILAEISMEHQAISDLINRGDLGQVLPSQRTLARKFLGLVLGQILTLEDSQEKTQMLSFWTS